MHAADRSGIGLSKASEGRRVALLITGLGSFLVPFMGSAVNIAIPVLGREFEVDAVTLGWVASSYLLAAGIFILPLGRLADIHGRKRVFTYGIIVFTISSLLCAVSKSPIQLISFRFLRLGVGVNPTYQEAWRGYRRWRLTRKYRILSPLSRSVLPEL